MYKKLWMVLIVPLNLIGARTEPSERPRFKSLAEPASMVTSNDTWSSPVSIAEIVITYRPSSTGIENITRNVEPVKGLSLSLPNVEQNKLHRLIVSASVGHQISHDNPALEPEKKECFFAQQGDEQSDSDDGNMFRMDL